MQVDLFLTKKEQLIAFLKSKGFFSTHEVIEWGTRNYYNRAAQTKGDMRIAGIIRKLSEDEKAFRGFRCKDDCYEYIK